MATSPLITSTPNTTNAGQASDPSANPSVVSMWTKPKINLAGLPVFSGKPGENIKEFFAKIGQRAAIDRWTREETANIIKYQLTGEAFELLDSEEILRDSDVTPVQIEKFLFSKYTRKVIPGQGLLKLNKCIQNQKELVSEYATRLKIVGRELLKENMSTVDPTDDADVRATKKRHEKDLILQFQRGVNPDLAKMIVFEMARNPVNSFEEAVELAQQAELSSEVLQQSRRQNEWKVLETDERPPIAQAQHGSYNRNAQYNNKNLKCFKCSKIGHTARECRSTNIVKCYSCGKPGHYSNECRQAQYRNVQRGPANVNSYNAYDRNVPSTSNTWKKTTINGATLRKNRQANNRKSLN